jgi:hypothetical protein
MALAGKSRVTRGENFWGRLGDSFDRPTLFANVLGVDTFALHEIVSPKVIYWQAYFWGIYRFFLEQKNLTPSTINVRLAAVRRLAYEASDTGLLSPELAAGIRRVKGAKRLGVRIGNWLTIEQARGLLQEQPW